MEGNYEPYVMYIDMNSYFASCEQQRHPELRGKPLGVIAYDGPNAAVIAASIEAKRFGVKTGMRLGECRQLCPGMLTITTHPAWYRTIHVDVMNILRRYCDDVIPRSIDEAVANFRSYRLVYKDLTGIAQAIKSDIRSQYDYLTCSIGIAPNTFLAKLGTELQKPDGLVTITPANIDEQLAKLRLTDLPGIATANEKRLLLIGIRNPVEMRHASPALLRKAFGGVVGEYWHKRLNFAEVDLYSRAENKTMSTTRTLSSRQSSDPQQLESMLISLCTRLEQRMVKAGIFCKEIAFSLRYRDRTEWETAIKLADPVQDAMEMRQYIQQKMDEFTQARSIPTLLTSSVIKMTVVIHSFVNSQVMQYSLFDNRMKKDMLRKVVYDIKDAYDQKNIVRRGSELLRPYVMKDAIGFGSVKDMLVTDGEVRNRHMLEEDETPGQAPRFSTLRKVTHIPDSPPDYTDLLGDDQFDF